MVSGCQSSGILAVGSSTTVVNGNTKLVSVHASNSHATNLMTIKVYDNTAGSAVPPTNKQVAELVIAPKSSFEYDMHGVICRHGLHVTVTGGTGNATVEYA
jgi:hypothetical protein